MSAEATVTQKQEAGTGTGAEATRAQPSFLPYTDIYEREDAIIVEAQMPGVSPEAVEVNLEGNELTIAGRVDKAPIEGHELSYAEYEVGDYERKFRIAVPVDADNIDATMKNGVLHVVLPKAEEARPHKIEVKAG
jgi:HSP20 family protein